MEKETHLQKVIAIDPDKCTGCHSCEMACSMKNFGKCSHLLSRIQVIEFRDINTFIPIICQGCEDAPCIKVCPTGAITRNSSGAVVISEDACIGCRACMYVCPTAAPVVNPENGKLMTCDLCEGEEEPWCVKACEMQGALRLVPKYQTTAKKRRDDFAWKMKEEFKPKIKEEEKVAGFSFG
jgi:Fe-S-cluster-containing dehydrogenase component